MNKMLLVLGLAAIVLLASCAAGPHQLRRSVDGWDQKVYVDSPLVDGILWVVPVFPICHMIAGIGDFLLVDAYHFWAVDLWRGKGTGFQHKDMKADQFMKGVLVDDGGFFKMHKAASGM